MKKILFKLIVLFLFYLVIFFSKKFIGFEDTVLSMISLFLSFYCFDKCEK